MDAFVSRLDPKGEYAKLVFTADFLSRNSTEAALSRPDLEQLSKRIDQLISDALAMEDVPANLRFAVVQSFEAARQAVLEYVLPGPHGVKAELERGLGRIGLTARDVPQTEKSKGVHRLGGAGDTRHRNDGLSRQ